MHHDKQSLTAEHAAFFTRRVDRLELAVETLDSRTHAQLVRYFVKWRPRCAFATAAQYGDDTDALPALTMFQVAQEH